MFKKLLVALALLSGPVLADEVKTADLRHLEVIRVDQHIVGFVFTDKDYKSHEISVDDCIDSDECTKAVDKFLSDDNKDNVGVVELASKKCPAGPQI